MKIVDHPKLFESFKLSKETAIKTNPLVALNGHQHYEIEEGRPNLCKLMKLLDTKPFYYYTQNKLYYFTEG